MDRNPVGNVGDELFVVRPIENFAAGAGSQKVEMIAKAAWRVSLRSADNLMEPAAILLRSLRKELV